MPSRNGGAGSSLPLFNSGHMAGAPSSRIPLPRACLSPRIFLSCILVTFSLSWVLLYSSSPLSLGLYSAADHDNDDWTRLEQQTLGSGSGNVNSPASSLSKTLRWRNSTLISSFSCETITPHKANPLRVGFNRATVCTIQNLCVDAERGGCSLTPICSLGSCLFNLLTILSLRYSHQVHGSTLPRARKNFPISISFLLIQPPIHISGLPLSANFLLGAIDLWTRPFLSTEAILPTGAPGQ